MSSTSSLNCRTDDSCDIGEARFDKESLIRGHAQRSSKIARLHCIPGSTQGVAARTPRRTSSSIVLLPNNIASGEDALSRLYLEIHDQKATRPLITVNCAALTDSALETELFGHEIGELCATSGARRGAFEQADGGVLFIEEIGNLPLSTQARLYRTLQESMIVRIGGEVGIFVNINLVCTTSQDLQELVSKGKFREDLFYRICAIQIQIPPLDSSKQDLLWLAQLILNPHFEKRLARGSSHPLAADNLPICSWPDAAPKMTNRIERGLVILEKPIHCARLVFESAEQEVGERETPRGPLDTYLKSCESRYIERALQANRGNITKAAESLDISRTTIWEKMRKFGLYPGNRIASSGKSATKRDQSRQRNETTT